MAQIALRCQELLHQPRAGEQVAGSWGSGAGLVLEETRAAMSRLLKVLRTCLVRRSLTAVPLLDNFLVLVWVLTEGPRAV